jgi:multiple sugar transport system substrate-binding protein
MKDKSLEAHDAMRRTVVKGGLGAAALAALPGGFVGHAIAQGAGGFDWKRFKGEKIEVSMVKSPRADLLQKYQKEFEDLTGISVGAEQIPEQQHRQKVVIEFNSGKTSFDVIQLSYHVQKRQFATAKWLEDIRPMLADAKMTAPDLDMKDFSAGGMFYATQTDGRIDSLPINIDPWILYWNRELFAAKGVAYPKNFDEILAAAVKLNDPAKGIAGMVARGLKNANVPVWSSFMLGYGGEFFDKNGRLATDSAEAVAGAELYKKLLKDTGPAGVAGFNWNECQSLFLQGKAAMWIDGSGFAPPLEDATKSKVVGKTGYGLMPPGPKAQVSAMFGDGIGISRYSTHKGAAWLYLQWATGKAMQARMLQTGSGAPVRNSAFGNVEALKALTVPKEWVDTVVGSLGIARPGLPIINPVTEFRDIIGIALTNMINGADAATELKRATAEFLPVLEKSEKA